MPALPSLFARLITEEPLPIDDLDAQPLQDLTRIDLRVIARQALDLLGAGVGTLLVELGVRRADLPEPLRTTDLATSAGFAAVRAGTRTIARGEPDRLLARLVQRALQAIAARVEGAPAALRLSRWGSDGGFGEEALAAVRALQGWRGLPVTGTVGAAEAAAIATLLADAQVPDLFDAGHPVVALGPGPRRIVAIAERLCAATRAAPFAMRVDGARYSYDAEQFGTAVRGGLLRAPGGVAYGTSTAYWKCNVFGGTVLALAELPVPTFQVGRYRHFPRAERFGEALARKPGWDLLAHLDHRDPADPTRARVGAALDAEIEALLRRMQPGDLFFVDHPGLPGDDGGHTRICTRPAERDDSDAAPRFAQARHDAAREVRDGTRTLTGGRETQFWLLRSTS